MKHEFTQGHKRRLINTEIDVKIKLSILWSSAMFLYIYNDLFSLYVPGALEQVLAGKMGAFPPTSQGLLLVFAVSMAIPALMVLVALCLRASLSRWLNVGVGLFYAAFVGWTLTMEDAWAFYILLGLIEVALTLLIAWTAWTWPTEPADGQE